MISNFAWYIDVEVWQRVNLGDQAVTSDAINLKLGPGRANRSLADFLLAQTARCNATTVVISSASHRTHHFYHLLVCLQ
jgi:hypothetical protein